MDNQQHGFEALRLDANGFRFDAIAGGAPDAPLVLFLHGWPSFATSWRAVMSPVAAAGFRAVAVDQRGYSPGARPGAVTDYAVDHLLADIEGFARSLAGSARFHLVGHDWGGLIAWPYAAHHPERLASLTVLSTPHSKAFPPDMSRSGRCSATMRGSYAPSTAASCRLRPPKKTCPASASRARSPRRSTGIARSTTRGSDHP
jgi:pimeloyl-ACP methyl ester carboxylesterase